MRDFVEQQLAHKLFTEDEYESMCPVCEMCGQHITYGDYFYDVDDVYVCTDINCIKQFMNRFKRDIMSYVENGR